MATKLIKPAEIMPQSRQADPATTGIGINFGAALAKARDLPKASLPFRAVNRSDAADYNPGFQRHHLLPRQLLQQRCFGPLFDLLGRERLGFDDFRSNGLLLPASDTAAVRIGLPMHRGPHRDYNSLVIERVGQVEAGWAQRRRLAPEIAASEAVQRLKLLQKALRRRLLNPRAKKFVLNRNDPIGRNFDFSEIDAMVDTLWPDTEAVAVPDWTPPSCQTEWAVADLQRPAQNAAQDAMEQALIAPAFGHIEPQIAQTTLQPPMRPSKSAFAF